MAFGKKSLRIFFLALATIFFLVAAGLYKYKAAIYENSDRFPLTLPLLPEDKNFVTRTFVPVADGIMKWEFESVDKSKLEQPICSPNISAKSAKCQPAISEMKNLDWQIFEDGRLVKNRISKIDADKQKASEIRVLHKQINAFKVKEGKKYRIEFSLDSGMQKTGVSFSAIRIFYFSKDLKRIVVVSQLRGLAIVISGVLAAICLFIYGGLCLSKTATFK